MSREDLRMALGNRYLRFVQIALVRELVPIESENNLFAPLGSAD